MHLCTISRPINFIGKFLWSQYCGTDICDSKIDSVLVEKIKQVRKAGNESDTFLGVTIRSKFFYGSKNAEYQNISGFLGNCPVMVGYIIHTSIPPVTTTPLLETK